MDRFAVHVDIMGSPKDTSSSRDSEATHPPQPAPTSEASGSRPRILKRKGQRPSKPRRTQLEIQYHPADIRRGVRYYFLSQRQVLAWAVGAALFACFLVLAATVLPSVVADRLAVSRYQAELEERAFQGERLKRLVQELETLQTSSDEVRLEMSKIYLAYGFSEDESHGQGGYPYEPESVPESIYADSIRRGNGLQARISEQFAVLETFLDEVKSFEDAHLSQVRSTPSMSPVRSADFVLTSPFGTRTSPFTKKADFHAGVDMAAATGTPIYATADGVVSFAGRYPLKQSVGWWRYGNMVSILHGDRFISLYGHCDDVTVRAGQKVKQGDLIATVGNTGWSTSPHLHYEVRRSTDEGDFQPVDPRIYMLDHRWRDAERLLIRARQAPDARDYEPLPRTLRR